MIGKSCEVAVDVGGSSLKISVIPEGGELSTPIKYPLPLIFRDRKQVSQRMANVVKEVISHYADGLSPSLIAFSFSGSINLTKNTIIYSWCLEDA